MMNTIEQYEDDDDNNTPTPAGTIEPTAETIIECRMPETINKLFRGRTPDAWSTTLSCIQYNVEGLYPMSF